MNRSQVIKILKINGVAATASDEEVRSVLLSARYTKEEVDDAIVTLRENKKPMQSNVSGLHKVFRTNDSLNSGEISQLLGIDVDIKEMPTENYKQGSISTTYFLFITIFSIIVAGGAVLIFMYMNQIGVFHPTAGVTFFNDFHF